MIVYILTITVIADHLKILFYYIDYIIQAIFHTMLTHMILIDLNPICIIQWNEIMYYIFEILIFNVSPKTN